MSLALFDLGARLRAAETRTPTPVAQYAPLLPPNNPVAVLVQDVAGESVVSATDGRTTATRSGAKALTALDELGVGLDEIHRTLVVSDRAAMTHLARLAHANPRAAAAPVIAWWDQRADHPGTGAVVLTIEAARSRWVLGTAPDTERDLTPWLSWLGIDGAGADALLRLARRVANGPVLPGLLDYAGDDSNSWAYHRRRLAKGWSWASADSRMEAALGLATRSHATDLFESLRLADPLVATRAAWTGTVVSGVVQRADKDALVVAAHRPVSRLRVGAKVEGWAGHPGDVGTSDHLLRSGVVAETTLTSGGTLLVTVTDHVSSPHTFRPLETLSLRPARVVRSQQWMSRRGMRARYTRGGNWIAGRGRPPALRSDVPLDVVLAAADSTE